MPRMLQRANRVKNQYGYRTLLSRGTRYIKDEIAKQYQAYVWARLPKMADHGVRNTVKVAEFERRLFDSIVPWYTPSNIPDYKQPNVTQVRNRVRPGDTVTVIGGGQGVTSVVAARQTGPDGSVIIYEGSKERALRIQESLNLNDVTDICEVRAAIVGSGLSVEGAESTTRIPADELSPVDVLEMDCEGAEIDILRELTIRPRVIIVESHHEMAFSPYDSEDDLWKALEDLGYDVERFTGPWVNSLLVGANMNES